MTIIPHKRNLAQEIVEKFPNVTGRSLVNVRGNSFGLGVQVWRRYIEGELLRSEGGELHPGGKKNFAQVFGSPKFQNFWDAYYTKVRTS